MTALSIPLGFPIIFSSVGQINNSGEFIEIFPDTTNDEDGDVGLTSQNKEKDVPNNVENNLQSVEEGDNLDNDDDENIIDKRK